ncbi:hypothetical protein GKZ68_12285 [Hymenobacter sp. BRD128]|uniref:hypothetical protein n=1 Tax=Hymenobacter sp. BRD128 TaxID=2675878 RepID=UPI001565BBE4|nr:hypothetical protein [Hymenobacter sp. BRD128]QKG57328.1 hypothetical protein GKZ68_12285 [Hymenobacter sp. BRD128]
MNFISEIETSIQALFAAINAGFVQDTSTGQQQVSNWQQALSSSDIPAVRLVATELEVLNGYIQRNDVAGMGASFQKLAILTSQSALPLHAFGGIGDKIRELSQKLNSAGGNLQIIARQRAAGTAPAH